MAYPESVTMVGQDYGGNVCLLSWFYHPADHNKRSQYIPWTGWHHTPPPRTLQVLTHTLEESLNGQDTRLACR